MLIYTGLLTCGAFGCVLLESLFVFFLYQVIEILDKEFESRKKQSKKNYELYQLKGEKSSKIDLWHIYNLLTEEWSIQASQE